MEHDGRIRSIPVLIKNGGKFKSQDELEFNLWVILWRCQTQTYFPAGLAGLLCVYTWSPQCFFYLDCTLITFASYVYTWNIPVWMLSRFWRRRKSLMLAEEKGAAFPPDTRTCLIMEILEKSRKHLLMVIIVTSQVRA